MHGLLRLSTVVVLALSALSHARPTQTTHNVTHVGEIPCQGSSYIESQKVGDGNPHQNFVFKQISGSTDCSDNPGGGAIITQSKEVSWTASLGFATEYITGGFSVEESTTTGSSNSFTCPSGYKGDVCVFSRIQTTAFTAQSRQCTVSTCTGTTCGGWSTGVIYDPNSAQGGCYYDNIQLGLSCGVPGSEHNVHAGPAGGPHFIACLPSQI